MPQKTVRTETTTETLDQESPNEFAFYELGDEDEAHIVVRRIATGKTPTHLGRVFLPTTLEDILAFLVQSGHATGGDVIELHLAKVAARGNRIDARQLRVQLPMQMRMTQQPAEPAALAPPAAATSPEVLTELGELRGQLKAMQMQPRGGTGFSFDGLAALITACAPILEGMIANRPDAFKLARQMVETFQQAQEHGAESALSVLDRLPAGLLGGEEPAGPGSEILKMLNDLGIKIDFAKLFGKISATEEPENGSAPAVGPPPPTAGEAGPAMHPTYATDATKDAATEEPAN